MYRRLLLSTATAVALALGPSQVLAKAPYGYWGFDLMGTELVDDDDAFGKDFDDRSGAVRIHGGYRPNDWIGIEGGLSGLGRYEVNSNRFTYSAATISAMFYLPFATRTVDLYARLGGGVARISDRDRRSSADIKPVGVAGLGLQFHVNPHLAFRAGADAYVLEPRVTDVDGERRRARQTIGAGYLGLSVLF